MSRFVEANETSTLCTFWSTILVSVFISPWSFLVALSPLLILQNLRVASSSPWIRGLRVKPLHCSIQSIDVGHPSTPPVKVYNPSRLCQIARDAVDAKSLEISELYFIKVSPNMRQHKSILILQAPLIGNIARRMRTNRQVYGSLGGHSQVDAAKGFCSAEDGHTVLVRLSGLGFLILRHQLSAVAHVACGRRAFFAVETVFF